MSNASLPWSIKGVSDEARLAAREAADAAGTTVGAWLSETILAAATAGPGASVGPSSDPAIAAAIERLAHDIARRDTHANEIVDTLRATIARLEDRLSSLETR